MTGITLPNKSRTKKDPVLSADWYENDVAIKEVVEGKLDNGNLSGSAGITGANIADGTITAEKLASGLGGSAKVTSIATEESRTNTAYGLMTTPDKVEKVALPTAGLLFVAYSAQMKASVNNVGRAAIFLGANQLKTRWNGGVALTEAAVVLLASEGFRMLRTAPFGLYTGTAGISEADSTTGETLGTAVLSGGFNANLEIGSETVALGTTALDGICVIHAAAGTYDVSVQFKSSSGSVTAKERKLRVWTQEFA